jgi:hypothetical protein
MLRTLTEVKIVVGTVYMMCVCACVPVNWGLFVTFMLDVVIASNLLLISNGKCVHMYASMAYRP